MATRTTGPDWGRLADPSLYEKLDQYFKQRKMRTEPPWFDSTAAILLFSQITLKKNKPKQINLVEDVYSNLSLLFHIRG